jgi:flavin reductase (DIM6/NTAB) family NADH-FMN oxidoreductase RutF
MAIGGKADIITLGMYMSISFDPSLVCIGISPKRYSHDLIIKAGEFVVNILAINLARAMHFCGTKSGKNFDKFVATGLTPIPAEKVNPPLIKECFGHLSVKLCKHMFVVITHSLLEKLLQLELMKRY